MLVRMWMTRKPVTIGPEASISDAATTMARHKLRHLPVTREAKGGLLLVGIVTSHDVARAFPPDLNPFSIAAWDCPIRRPVSEIMARTLQTVEPETAIEDAARVLLTHRIGALPVVADARLVGIVTESDIFRAFMEIVGATEEGVRVTFDLTEDEDMLDAVIAIGRRHGLRLGSILSMHHDGRRLGVVRLLGAEPEGFVDEVWRAGHRVLSVVRSEFAQP
jgi:acetoin utilization protein AcuB